MPTYKIEGEYLTSCTMTVDAENEKEAIEKAFGGDHNQDVDTEPQGPTNKRNWYATES